MKACILLCIVVAFCAGCDRRNQAPIAPDKDLVGAFDEPQNGAEFNRQFAIRGWAASEDGIRWVGVYVDGEFLGYARTGLSRPDVYRAYLGLKNSATSGWQFDADPGLFTQGGHRIAVEVCSQTGVIHALGAVSVNIDH
jgi:hypothetical protein